MDNAYELARDVLSAIDQDRCSFISPAIRTMLLKAWGDGKVEMQNNPHAEQARELIDAERARQDAKWGEQNHDPQVWMAILGEEFGELCQAANDLRWPKVHPPVLDIDHMLAEAVQTAAVSRAIVECLLRAKWQWPRKQAACDASKRCAIMTNDFGADMYLGLPCSLPSKTRNIAWSPVINDWTLIGSSDECESVIAMLSGVCGASGLKVVEVPHA